MESFSIETVLRSFQVCKEVWDAAVGEKLLVCSGDIGSPHDPVAMVRSPNTVGHVPGRISPTCSACLGPGGSITYTVTDSRLYSGDLQQGWLETPCVLKFEGGVKEEVAKAEKLIKAALMSSASQDETKSPRKRKDAPTNTKGRDGTRSLRKERYHVLPEQKKKKLFHVNKEQLHAVEASITKGDLLSDLPINLAQHFLQSQFPQIEGLQSTLLQSKKRPPSGRLKNQLQIVHGHRNHWIVVSSIKCEDGAVNVYDSLYDSLDASTREVVFNLFGRVGLNFVRTQKQSGGRDCGLFAIANATAIANGIDPLKLKFNQGAMRSHLVSCFKNKTMTLFPQSISWCV